MNTSGMFSDIRLLIRATALGPIARGRSVPALRGRNIKGKGKYQFRGRMSEMAPGRSAQPSKTLGCPGRPSLSNQRPRCQLKSQMNTRAVSFVLLFKIDRKRHNTLPPLNRKQNQTTSSQLQWHPLIKRGYLELIKKKIKLNQRVTIHTRTKMWI